MDKTYDKLFFFENIYLCMKGKKDGKKGNFEKINDICVSPFMRNEMSAYNRYCLKIKEEYVEEFYKHIEIIKKQIDLMNLEHVEYVRMKTQIENRKKMLDETKDKEELIDLEARYEQLIIDERARIAAHRDIAIDSISILELLLKAYDQKVSIKKAHYYQRQMKYLEYAGKYITDIKIDFIKIEDICVACDIKEAFEDDRKLIEHFKSVIEYDTDYEDSMKGDS